MDSIIRHYGTPIKKYLMIHGWINSVDSKFPVIVTMAQYNNGRILLFLDLSETKGLPRIVPIPGYISGKTPDNLAFQIKNLDIDIDWLYENKNPYTQAYELTELEFRTESTKFNRVIVYITNFRFDGDNKDDNTLIIETTQYGPIIIRKVKEYNNIIRDLITNHSIDITASIEITLNSQVNEEEVLKFADFLCLILSVSRGTKVNRLYHELFDDEKVISRKHIKSIQRPYSGSLLSPIGDKPQEIKLLIQDCIINYQSLTNTKDFYRLINMYINARTQDYREIQGLSAIIALEVLKNFGLNQNIEGLDEFILSSKSFKLFEKLITQIISKILNECPISTQINNNIKCLRRVSFKTMIIKICEFYRIDFDKKELQLVIDSRNSLIHQGKYLCERQKTLSKTPFEEYLFIISFMDSAILRILGYDGPIRKPKSNHFTIYN